MPYRKQLILLILLIILLPATALAQETNGQVYIVQADDTLFTIAEKNLGDGFRYPEIAEATNQQNAVDQTFALINDVNLLEVGDKLLISTSKGEPTVPIALTATPAPTSSSID